MEFHICSLWYDWIFNWN